MTRQEVFVKRFSFSLLAASLAVAGIAACNDQSPQADSSSVPPAAPPAASSRAEPAAKGSPQTKLAADMELSGKVKELLQEPGRGRVEVAASDGVVTLYGTVEKPADKDRIALSVMEVEGVRSVVNNLVVMRES
jgi:hypothetical protein